MYGIEILQIAIEIKWLKYCKYYMFGLISYFYLDFRQKTWGDLQSLTVTIKKKIRLSYLDLFHTL